MALNRNMMIIMVGGFLIAVLVALMVQALLGGGDKSDQPVVVQQEAKVQIIVADKNLPIGTALGKKDARWQEWPEGAVFDGAIVREDNQAIESVIKGTLKRDVLAGQPIMKADMVDSTQKNLMSAVLTPGMRAVSIDVDASSMVAGFIAPGDKVDVVMTYKMDVSFEGDDDPEVQNMISQTIDRNAAETVLQNIKVLAIDQAPVRDKDEAKVGRTVTLEVDLRGAEVLALGSTMGDLSLALRHMGDDQLVVRDDGWVSDTLITKAHQQVMDKIAHMDGNPMRRNQVDSFAGMPNQINASQTHNFVRIYRGERVQSLESN